MGAIAEVLGVCSVFAASGVVTFFATTTIRRMEYRRRKSEMSARWRRNAKRTCAEGDRLIRFRMAEDYRAEREREKRCANTIVKGCLADEFYALDDDGRKAVLLRG